MGQGDKFHRIIDLINEAMLDDTHWPYASALIDEICGSKGNILFFGKARSGNAPSNIYLARCCFRGEERPEQMREYLKYYHPLDEHVSRMHKLPDGKIVSVAEVFTEEERKKSQVYNEAYLRYEIQNALEVRLDMPGGSHIAWGIADPVDSRGWSMSRVEVISRLIPHIRQYVRVRAALAEANALRATVVELADHASMGILQLDQRGTVLNMNKKASELIRKDNGLSCLNNSLSCKQPIVQARLNGLLASALPRYGEQGRSGSMMIRRDSLLPVLALHVVPVEIRNRHYQTSRIAALVLLVDPVDRTGIDPAQVRESLGLTPRESRIAAMLAEGRTLHQIAAMTGRSYRTIRSQLNPIFTKFGVSRQVDLIQVIQALSRIPFSKD